MWDKEYSFPYVSVKDTVPAYCFIEDKINFNGNDICPETSNTTPPSGLTTTITGAGHHDRSSSCSKQGLETVL